MTSVRVPRPDRNEHLHSGDRSGLWVLQDYPCFPIMIVVTASGVAEPRFAKAARAASVGRYARLPLLLT